ncbi:MAG: hypothetical protein ACT4O0_20150 [Pseudonocardia sp.]
MAAHFKPFTRARSGAPSQRDSSRRSWTDSSRSYRRRYRRGGLISLDIL